MYPVRIYVLFRGGDLFLKFMHLVDVPKYGSGLSVAKTLIQDQEGDLIIKNCSPSGLHVLVFLPVIME